MADVLIRTAGGGGVAERWRRQYQHPVDGWGSTVHGPAKEVYERLCDLGQAPPAAAIAEIIGNKSWSYLTCSGCNEYVERAVEFADGYGESDTLLCAPCIEQGRAALSVIDTDSGSEKK